MGSISLTRYLCFKIDNNINSNLIYLKYLSVKSTYCKLYYCYINLFFLKKRRRHFISIRHKLCKIKILKEYILVFNLQNNKDGAF